MRENEVADSGRICLYVMSSMISTIALIALISGFFHASWNAIAKSLGGTRAVTIAALMVAWVVTLAFLCVRHEPGPGADAFKWIVLAAAGEAGYVVTLGIALSRGDLGLTYGVSRAVALFVIWPLSFLVFGKSPTTMELIASAVLVIGIIVCQQGARVANNPFSLLWSVVTGAFVGVYHTGYKGAVVHGAGPATAFAIALGLSTSALWLLSGRKIRAEIATLFRTRAMTLLAAGALCATSFILAIFALRSVDSGRVLGLRNSSVGFAALFGYAMGERPSKLGWLGLCVVFAGVAGLALFE